MAAIVLAGIGKRFGATVAVDGVDLEIAEGRFVALLGPSGCGKSTLLRMISGLETPSAGRIAIGGRDVTALPPEQRNVGLMFQSYALFPHMTVAENLRFPLRMRRGLARAEEDSRIARALALVRLPDIGARLPRQLSGGQQQRVAFARALIDEPDLLLLDEPLSNLDARLRDEMQLELAELRRQIPITTIMVTHDQHEALALADEVVVMRAGRIEQVGAPAAIYAAPATPFVAEFLGAANLVAVALAGEGAAWRARLPDGVEIAVEAPADGRGGARTLALRQEEVALLGYGERAEVELSGRVAAAVFRGASLQVAVDAGGARLRLAAPGDTRLAVGAPVRLGWRRAAGRIL